jgi:hypothetical protein
LTIFSNQLFCVWDYSSYDPFFTRYSKISILRFFKSQIADISYNQNMRKLGFYKKSFLLFRRILAVFITLVMFVAAFVGIYYLQIGINLVTIKIQLFFVSYFKHAYIKFFPGKENSIKQTNSIGYGICSCTWS